MATKSTNKILWNRANLFFGAVGSAPVTAVGYVSREGATSTTFSREYGQYYVEELQGPAAANTTSRGFQVTCQLAQLEPELLALALGLAADGQEVLVGGPNAADTEVALKIVANRRDGVPVTIEIPRAKASGELGHAFSTGAATETPLQFSAMDGEAGMVKITFGPGNIIVTPSGGTLSRVAGAGYHRVQGPATGIDAITSINGETLTNGETLRLQLADAEQVKFVHEYGVLELFGGVDWTLDHPDDYLDLVYETAGTRWLEIGRRDVKP